MAPISTPQYTNTQDVVDQIQRQFTLSPETLVDLTKAFLNEFELGLGSYGQAMAMMYARFLLYFTIADRALVRRSSLASPMAQKPGKSADPVITLAIIERPFLALSWHSILEVPTCALAVEYCIDCSMTNGWMSSCQARLRSRSKRRQDFQLGPTKIQS